MSRDFVTLQIRFEQEQSPEHELMEVGGTARDVFHISRCPKQSIKQYRLLLM